MSQVAVCLGRECVDRMYMYKWEPWTNCLYRLASLWSVCFELFGSHQHGTPGKTCTINTILYLVVEDTNPEKCPAVGPFRNPGNELPSGGGY